MVEYRESAHAVWDIKYHLVWITKYRYKILRGEVAERARALIRQICEARDVTIIRGAVSADHIHMLVSVPPQLAPSKLVQYIKGRSSRMLQADCPRAPCPGRGPPPRRNGRRSRWKRLRPEGPAQSRRRVAHSKTSQRRVNARRPPPLGHRLLRVRSRIGQGHLRVDGHRHPRGVRLGAVCAAITAGASLGSGSLMLTTAAINSVATGGVYDRPLEIASSSRRRSPHGVSQPRLDDAKRAGRGV